MDNSFVFAENLFVMIYWWKSVVQFVPLLLDRYMMSGLWNIWLALWIQLLNTSGPMIHSVGLSLVQKRHQVTRCYLINPYRTVLIYQPTSSYLVTVVFHAPVSNPKFTILFKRYYYYSAIFFQKFFVRCLKHDSGSKFACANNNRCEITKETRTQCPHCRYQKCLSLGMYGPGKHNVYICICFMRNMCTIVHFSLDNILYWICLTYTVSIKPNSLKLMAYLVLYWFIYSVMIVDTMFSIVKCLPYCFSCENLWHYWFSSCGILSEIIL